MNKRSFSALAVSATLLLSVLTGCGAPKATPTPAPTTPASESTTPAPTAESTAPADEQTGDAGAYSFPYDGPDHISFGDAENMTPSDDQLLIWFEPKVINNLQREGNTLDSLNMIAEKHGVDFLICNQSDSKGDMFKLKIQEGKVPEMLETHADMGVYLQEARDGVLAEIPVDLVKSAMPRFTEWIERNCGPDIWEKMMVDGKMYALPNIWELGAYAMGVAVHKDVFEAAGATVPTTIDEWTAALEKIKAADPTKYGFTSYKDFSAAESLSWVYGAYGVAPDTFYEKDGKIVYGSIEPGAKDALAVCADWYKKGYIDPEFNTIDGDTAKAKWMDKSVASTYYWSWSYYPTGTFKFGAGDYYEDGVEHVQLPTGPNGESGAVQNPSIGPGQCFAKGISEEKMEQYFKLWDDCAFNVDTMKLFTGGVEGQTYEFNDEGTFQFINSEEFGTLADELNPDGSVKVDNSVNRHKLGITCEFNCIPVAVNDYTAQNWNADARYKDLAASMPGKNPGKYDVMSTFQRPVYLEIKDQLDTLATNFHNDVITGKKSIDQFDAFVKEWLDLGGQKVLDEANQLYYQ